MIDIGEKDVSRRTASARGSIILSKKTIDAIKSGKIEKGDALEVARVAAIGAVKLTPMIIPMCHPIPIDGVNVEFKMERDRVTVDVLVKSTGRTGVEMEAITAVSVALLTVWDMVKYLEKDAKGQYPKTRIAGIEVIKKEKISI